MKLQDVQGRLEVGLRLRQLHLDGPQTVDVGRRQVHSQQRQVDLEGRNPAVRNWLGVEQEGWVYCDETDKLVSL